MKKKQQDDVEIRDISLTYVKTHGNFFPAIFFRRHNTKGRSERERKKGIGEELFKHQRGDNKLTRGLSI